MINNLESGRARAHVTHFSRTILDFENCATAGRPAFNNEVYTARLFGALTTVGLYAIVMLYTKAQTPLVRFVVDLLRFAKHVDNKSNQ